MAPFQIMGVNFYLSIYLSILGGAVTHLLVLNLLMKKHGKKKQWWKHCLCTFIVVFEKINLPTFKYW